MFKLIAEAEKLKGILQAITAVNHEATVRITPTKLFVRAGNVRHKFTAVLHLDESWFDSYESNRTCTTKIDLQELDTFGDSRFVCIYKDERTEPGILSPPMHMRLSVLGSGINPLQTYFYGLSVEALEDTPLPEDEAIDGHNFKVQLHPKDLKRVLEHAIQSTDPMVSIDITDRKVTLSAGTLHINLKVCNVLVPKLTCKMEFDASKGILGQFVHKLNGASNSSGSSARPRQIKHTIHLNSSAYMSLLMASMIAGSVFVHFTPDDLTNIPSMFECIVNGEESAIFYFILPPPKW